MIDKKVAPIHVSNAKPLANSVGLELGIVAKIIRMKRPMAQRTKKTVEVIIAVTPHFSGELS